MTEAGAAKEPGGATEPERPTTIPAAEPAVLGAMLPGTASDPEAIPGAPDDEAKAEVGVVVVVIGEKRRAGGTTHTTEPGGGVASGGPPVLEGGAEPTAVTSTGFTAGAGTRSCRFIFQTITYTIIDATDTV